MKISVIDNFHRGNQRWGCFILFYVFLFSGKLIFDRQSNRESIGNFFFHDFQTKRFLLFVDLLLLCYSRGDLMGQ